MILLVRTLIVACLGLTFLSPVNALEPVNMTQRLNLKAGDIITQRSKDGWHTIKILAVDVWPDGSKAAHCLTYKASQNKPVLSSLGTKDVLVWHAPIDAKSFETGWLLIGNQKPSKEELSGFTEYLRLTDFPRYASFTQQDVKALIAKAMKYYDQANQLANQGQRNEAIQLYGEAIDTFPLFYEAIDNRALTYMEQGKIREALSDFEESLRIEPNGMTAFFSRGECLMKLGRLSEAETIFKEGVTKFPSDKDMFKKFLQQVQLLQKKSR